MSGQCPFDRRGVGCTTDPTAPPEIDAWERQRNACRRRIKWGLFTTDQSPRHNGPCYPVTIQRCHNHCDDYSRRPIVGPSFSVFGCQDGTKDIHALRWRLTERSLAKELGKARTIANILASLVGGDAAKIK